MANPLSNVAWDHCLLEASPNRQAEAALRRETGPVPAWLRYFLSCPWLARAGNELGVYDSLLVHLDYQTIDLLALVVSRENACRYCYSITRMQLRVLGMSESRMQELEQRLAGDALDARDAAIVHFARRFTRCMPLITPRDLDPLRETGRSDAEIREIAFAAASVAFFNRLATISALPPQSWEQLTDRWFAPLLRPFLARFFRGVRKLGAPMPFVPQPDGPFAELLGHYRDSPIGPVLVRTLDGMWNSSILSRRCKALMFAVIAHGLGCESSRADIAAVLESEGMTAQGAEKIIAHLGGDALADEESALLAFARDTIWYEPIQIQRRARGLRDQLSVAQFVEAIGVASLANSLSRLCAVLPKQP